MHQRGSYIPVAILEKERGRGRGREGEGEGGKEGEREREREREGGREQTTSSPQYRKVQTRLGGQPPQAYKEAKASPHVDQARLDCMNHHHREKGWEEVSTPLEGTVSFLQILPNLSYTIPLHVVATVLAGLHIFQSLRGDLP